MSESLSNPNLLCSPIVTETNVPLVLPDSTVTSHTVNVSACSEFKEYSLPVVHFDATHKLHFALDGDHQPLIFTIGKDKRFYCIRHIAGSSWDASDITPGTSGACAATFHLVQHNNNVAAAVALESVGGSMDLYYAQPFDVTDARFDLSKITFSKIKNNIGAVSISTVSVAAEDTKMERCLITVGSTANREKLATDYIINPGSGNEGDWRILSLQEDSTEVVKTLAVTLRKPFYGCIASLYKETNVPSDSGVGTALACTSTDNNQAYNITVYLDNIGGGARDAAMAITPLGLSDLYVAGLKGVGYYASQKLTQDPIVILPDVSFKQVVADEKVVDKDKSQVSLYAVSTSDRLYFIQGIRDKRGHVPTFTCSGIPIRRDISFFSTQFNPAVNASEVVYVSTKNTQLKHMIRDPKTTMWTERAVHVKWQKEIESTYEAFETRVTFKSSTGVSVGANYETILTASEVTYALVNDKSYRLSDIPIIATTELGGCIRVVTPADLSISGPTLRFVISGGSHSRIVEVEPRQRVIHGLSKFPTGTHLKNAASTAGEPIFPNTTIPDGTFDDFAVVLQQATEAMTKNGSNSFQSMALARMNVSRNPAGSTLEPPHIMRLSFWSWLGGVVDDIEHAAEGAVDALGDVIESIGAGVEDLVNDIEDGIEDFVEDVVKTGVAVIDGVVNFVATVGGTIFKWVLDVAGSIFRGLVSCLKDVFGLDLRRFFLMFGYYLDHENIVKTQKIIMDSAIKAIPLLKDSLSSNISQLKYAIKNCKSDLSSYISDERISEQNETINWHSLRSTLDSSPPGQILMAYLDNPIIQEVFSFTYKWITKASGLVDEVLSLPGAAAITKLLEKLVKTASNLLAEEVDNLVRYINDVVSKIMELFSGKRNIGEFFTVLLSDGFWTFFDALQNFTDEFLDIIVDIIDAIVEVLTGEIHIPGVSGFWEGFNGTKFTALSVLSMSLAQILYLVTMMWKEKLPFELMPPWYDLLPPSYQNSSSASTVPTSSFRDHGDIRFSTEADNDKKEAIFIDLGFTLMSSLSVCIASALSFPFSEPTTERDGGGNGDESGLTPIEPENIPFLNDAPAPKTDTTITDAIQWMKLVFNSISVMSEAVLFIRGYPTPMYNGLKGIGLVLKGLDLVTTIGSLDGIHGNLPLAATLSPIANALNSLCGYIDFIYSDKRSSDGAALAVSISGHAGAACDIVAVIANAFDNIEIGGVATVASFTINIVGCAGGSLVVVCLKEKESKSKT